MSPCRCPDSQSRDMPNAPRVRVSIQTFGCRVNQYESEMMRDLLSSTYTIADESPDVVVLNACTVTALAERKARQAARRLRRENPASRIVLIGCLADAVEQGTTQFTDADLLVGNRWKSRIHEVVECAMSDLCGVMSVSSLDELNNERTQGPSHRIRAFLKIQDGCSRACTYCRTTQVRGEPRSKSIQAAVAEATDLVASGFPEIVLTGIDLAQYSPEGGDLDDAVRAIASLDGLQRLRIASINPSGITDKLIDVCASIEAVCPHFHIPLQSGDSEILKAMKRGYNAPMYVDTIERIRSRIPHATFGTDIIVGFPGEVKKAFARTLDMLDIVGYSNLHAFRYSPRKGTASALFPHQVLPEIKRQRSETLVAHWLGGLGRTLDNRIGSTQHVLVEEQQDAVWRGYTHDYLYVKFSSDRQIPIGSLLPVHITRRTGSTLEGVDDHRIDTS